MTWTLVALLLAAPSQAARIVVFGDSWGVPAAPALQQVLVDHGLTEAVAGAAISGDTAANLSKPPGLGYITDTLAAYPDADLVHLSIGGNDFLGAWSAAMSPAEEAMLFEAIVADVEAIVDHILALRPSAQILWSSYDFPRPIPQGTPSEVNAASLALGSLTAGLAAGKGAGLSYGNYSGLMQVSYGFDGVQYTIFDPPFPIPPGDPSLPDPTLPGPQAAFTDAIHLTAQGYAILAEAHFDSFYAARLLPQVAPVPALGPSTLAVVALLLLLTGTPYARGPRCGTMAAPWQPTAQRPRASAKRWRRSTG
jgi:lysophospholipase L1-like esterase